MLQIHLFAEWSKSSPHVKLEMTARRRASIYFKYYYRDFGIRWLIIDEVEKENFCSISLTVLKQQVAWN